MISPEISLEDMPHLQNIGYGGLMRSVTPDDVAERFMSQGHARMTTAGTLVLTEAGYKALGVPVGFIEIGRK